MNVTFVVVVGKSQQGVGLICAIRNPRERQDARFLWTACDIQVLQSRQEGKC